MNTKLLRAHFAATLAVSALLFGLPAIAASGVALGVKQSAELETNSAKKVLEVGSDVFVGDKVITGPSGQVQIKFTDNTELVVGPKSALTIEDYLLREDSSAGTFAIKALGGTFRFVTGQAQKDRYRIETPTGTIGVRGTAFDFTVEPAATMVLLYHGSVTMCTKDNQCSTLDNACDIGQYDLAQSLVLGNADAITGNARQAMKAGFRYSESQAPLMREFWVQDARECFNRGFEGGTPADLGVSESMEDMTQPSDCYDDHNCSGS